MKIRILLFLFLLTLLTTNHVKGRFSSRGSSRGSSRRGGSKHSSSPSSGGSSSDAHTTGSHSTGTLSGGHTTGSNPPRHETSSGDYTIRSYPTGTSSGGRTAGSNPTGTSSGQTAHQQNKDLSTSLLQAEGGGARRPWAPGSQAGKPAVATDNKQTSAPYPSAPYRPSAPPNDLSKSNVIPSQNSAPTSFGQPSAPSHGTGSPGNPSWSNPHYNPSQSYPLNPTSTNVGFKDHLRPTSMPVPSASYPIYGVNHYPHTRPVGHSNHSYNPGYPVPHSPIGHPSSYPSHIPPPVPGSFGNPYSTHPVGGAYGPGGYSYQSHSPIGHPSSYPSHIPPPVPGSFGNPYSTHPVGGAYGPGGYSYQPQQHVLSQPAAQPYIPGQTVIMVPGQQDSGRGFGQMVKEALVFSTINAGVNRLINPHQHYVSDPARPAGDGSTTSETHVTYNNNYFNTPSGVPAVPASPSAPQQNPFVPSIPATMYPASYPAYNPAATSGVSIPTIAGNNVTYSAGSTATGTANNMGGPPVVPPNEPPAGSTANGQVTSSQETPVHYSPQYKISDSELWNLTEELFAKQDINVSRYVTVYLQKKSENLTVAMHRALIHAEKEVYSHPTIMAIRALYDNYEHNSSVKENRTPEKRKEEDLLLNVFLNTNLMARAMRWLSERGFIDPDDFEQKDILRHIWFSQFDGATSGFERVFTSERYGTDLLGVQDWIYYEYQESRNRIYYMGYTDTLKLGDSASLVKLNFKMDDIVRPNATIFVGTLPELEMSLYTICFYARPNDLCPVSLGGTKFNIFTHSFRYYGRDLIDLALPMF